MIIHSSGTHLDRGDQAQKAGNYAEALTHFKAHLDQSPDDALGWRLLGDLYRELGEFGVAEAAYTTAIACPLDALPVYEQYQPNYHRALLYQYMGKYRAALGDIASAEYLATDEAWADPYHYRFFAKVRAELFEALGQFEMALGAYKNFYYALTQRINAHLGRPEVQQLEFRIQQQQSFGALSWSGAVLLSAMPDPTVPTPVLEAIQAEVKAFGRSKPLLKLAEQMPKDERAWRYLGHTYWYSGQDAEAQQAFARAYQLAPDAPENLFIQGCLAYFGQDKPQAMRYFNRADALGLPEYEHPHLHQYRACV